MVGVRNVGVIGHSVRCLGCLSYLDQFLARLEELKGVSQVARENPLQVHFRGVAVSNSTPLKKN